VADAGPQCKRFNSLLVMDEPLAIWRTPVETLTADAYLSIR
jgi:hypothetical protein